MACDISVVWNGDILTLRDCETAALWFRAALKPGEQERAVARLWANLQGLAKEVVRMCKPQDFEDARGVERLLRILRESPLASMPVPDAYTKIQAYDQIRRRPGEVIGDFFVREQRAFREMTEALRRVRNSRSEKSGVRRHDHRATSVNSSVCSEAEYEMVEKNKLVRLSLSGISTSPKSTSLSRRATDGLCWN